MKKLTNKQRCRKCIHKCVCQYQDYYAGVEGLERCNHYFSRERTYKERPPQWISVEDGLPKPEEFVIISAITSTGHRVNTVAMYEDGTIDRDESCWNWYDIEFDYNEETEQYFIPNGWWEYKHYNDGESLNYQIDDKVTHWMPFPEPPKDGMCEWQDHTAKKGGEG